MRVLTCLLTDWLDDDETVALIFELRGVTVATPTLRSWRRRRTGPAWSRVGKRVRYRRSDMVLWLEGQASDQLTAVV